MSKKQESQHQVPRLSMPREEFLAALERASENVRNWPSLRDSTPHPSAKAHSGKKQQSK